MGHSVCWIAAQLLTLFICLTCVFYWLVLMFMLVTAILLGV